ncbi:hypothetical protein TRIUR3_28254 [Triticum urartu]|uniref:Uncharacterized protein n=1 Tax=Triticum urartu TaxID=4572 RepID=M7ZN15_TRIUA|nr:hypothetical protein TRIUR3_28254 [Triticum urartu]
MRAVCLAWLGAGGQLVFHGDQRRGREGPVVGRGWSELHEGRHRAANGVKDPQGNAVGLLVRGERTALADRLDHDVQRAVAHMPLLLPTHAPNPHKEARELRIRTGWGGSRPLVVRGGGGEGPQIEWGGIYNVASDNDGFLHKDDARAWLTTLLVPKYKSKGNSTA